MVSSVGLHVGVALAGALLLFADACKPLDACAETVTPCGGDPVGAWAEASVCQDPVLQDTIAAKQTYRNQPIIPGGQPPPELTSMDWCSSLQYFGTQGIRFFALPRDTPAVQGAYLSYAPGGPPGQPDRAATAPASTTRQAAFRDSATRPAAAKSSASRSRTTVRPWAVSKRPTATIPPKGGARVRI